MPTISTPGFPDMHPIVTVGHSAERESRNIVHGSIDPAGTNDYFSLLTAARRTGAMILVFGNQDDAQECLDRHALRLVFTAHDEGVHTADMTYIVNGKLAIEQSDSRKTWLVTVPFRELEL
jgi:hypothetical protein